MSNPSRARRIVPGARVAPRELVTIAGLRLVVPDREHLVHLQFRRFAGCPICSFHLRSFARRGAELGAAGVREVVLFHSSADELRRYAGDLPLALAADPEKELYREFGVESSPRALLDPRAWPAILRAVAHGLWMMVREGRPLPPLDPAGGRIGLPADFLIAPDGRVLASKYGRHADDQWSVDEVLALARPVAAPGSANPAAGSGWAASPLVSAADGT